MLGCVPKRIKDITLQDVWHFIQVAQLEAQQAGYEDLHREKLMSFTYGVGNSLTRCAYYRQAYCRPLHRALTTMFSKRESPRILDIGCGTGGQAILFAVNGGNVLGLDVDEEQMATARARIKYFEQRTSKLNIELRNADVTNCDFASFGKFDAAYSHGCISRFLPADEIFKRIRPALETGGELIIKSENPDCLLIKASNRRAVDLSGRRQFLEAAKKHHFRPLIVAGTTAVPRKFWFLEEWTHAVDWWLRKIPALQIHLELIFEKVK